MRSRFIFCSLFLAVVAASVPSLAKEGPVYGRPVYNPETKSYFELVDLGTKGRRPWKKAYVLAKKRIFKGARGHLAVVNSAATNEFLKTTFRTKVSTWFGLRVWCLNYKKQWVTGEYIKRSGYQNWHPKWNWSSKGAGCGRTGRRGEEAYMPVAYILGKGGFRWIAIGGWKDFNAMFVEYPTGQE